jgi:DNA-binding MarR family transcriptional regulator
VEKGYVRREVTAEDRRATFAVLTEEGREAFERTTPPFVNSFYEHFSDKLSDKDLEDFVRMMRGLIGDEAAARTARAAEEPQSFALAR